MFNKFFKDKKKEDPHANEILLIALLIHAAKIDENYTDNEKQIIKKAIINLKQIAPEKAEELIKKAEVKEKDSNQIVEFTKEIKKNPMDYRIKVIEILWKIVYSDGSSDVYESNLIRRVCGLLYVSDKESGEIKQRIKNTF
tara:strand:- start:950 stop:1372 length:423 start_codon:yes stop_codon:yes gene_type:complete